LGKGILRQSCKKDCHKDYRDENYVFIKRIPFHFPFHFTAPNILADLMSNIDGIKGPKATLFPPQDIAFNVKKQYRILNLLLEPMKFVIPHQKGTKLQD
jgi:hypothetical protein